MFLDFNFEHLQFETFFFSYGLVHQFINNLECKQTKKKLQLLQLWILKFQQTKNGIGLFNVFFLQSIPNSFVN
jgi:hypothetical protein